MVTDRIRLLVCAIVFGGLASANSVNLASHITSTSTAIPSGRPTATPIGGDIGEIAFVSDRSGYNEIYLMNVDGSNQRQLTNLRADTLSSLKWSPDGKNLAFVVGDDESSEIYTMRADGSGLRRLTRNRFRDDEPDWAPDSRRIAFISTRDGPNDVYVMYADGTDVRRITHDPAWDMSPVWLADGRTIAFVPNAGANLQIWTVDPAGYDRFFERIETAVLQTVTGFAFSSDGKRIAIVSDFGAYIVNADGTGLRQVDARETYSYSGVPSWSPDDKYIVFASRRDDQSEIYMLNTEDWVLQRLTKDVAQDFGPSWRR